MIRTRLGTLKLDLHPIISLYFLVYVTSIGHSMMATLFVPMLMYPNNFIDDSVGRTTRTIYVGILLALFPLGRLLSASVIGSFSDRNGRKRVISYTLVFTILCCVLIAYSLQIRSLWLLMVSCFLCGLFESNVAIVQSAIADSSAPAERGRLFAYLFSARSLGYISGPLAGGQIALRYGYAHPFWILVALLVITYIWIMLGFRDTYEPDKEKPINYFKAFTNLFTVFTDLPIRRVYLINFLLFLATYGFWRVIQIYMVDKWNFNVGEVTFYFSYLAVMGTLANIFLFAPLSRRLGLQWLLIITAIVGGLFMISIVIPDSEVSYWFTAGPASLMLAMAIAGCGAYLSTLVGSDRQGRVLGNNLALEVGAESHSALFGGFLAAILIPLPLITYGVVAILGGLLLITYRRKAGNDEGVKVTS